MGKRLIAGAVALCVAGLGVSVVAAGPAAAGPATVRVAGGDRYETAVKVSQQWFTGTQRPGTVFVASGEVFPDALSITPVAALRKAPLLLVPRNGAPDVVLQEIGRLAPAEVVIVGGTGAVSDRVRDQIAAKVKNVQRIAGSDRYDTSRKVAEYGISVGAFGSGTTNVFVATGRDFPDALSAGAAAGLDTVKAPVILEDGKAGSMSAAGKAVLAKFSSAAKVSVIGGAGVMSDGLLASIPGANKQRVAGGDRYGTSQAVVAAFTTGRTSTKAVLATGTSFPDALAGAAFAGATGAALWVTAPACVSPGALAKGAALNVSIYILLGGTGALSVSLNTLMPCGTPDPQPSTTPSTSPSPTPSASATKPSGTPTNEFATTALPMINKYVVNVAQCPALRYDADLEAVAASSVIYGDDIPQIDESKITTKEGKTAETRRFYDAMHAEYLKQKSAIPARIARLGYSDYLVYMEEYGMNQTNEYMARSNVPSFLEANKADLDSCRFTAIGAAARTNTVYAILLAKD